MSADPYEHLTVPRLVDLGPGNGSPGPCLVWRLPRPLLSISSAILGGGLSTVEWVINMTVDADYSRMDPVQHLGEAARSLGLVGEGIGLMTAVDVGAMSSSLADGVAVVATVGVGRPVWAADSARAQSETVSGPGTINLVAQVPERLSPAALVNLVATVTEAKVQALLDHGVPGTGTASDAVCILCPTAGREQLFGGPRSEWGGRAAQATYAAVVDGVLRQRN